MSMLATVSAGGAESEGGVSRSGRPEASIAGHPVGGTPSERGPAPPTAATVDIIPAVHPSPSPWALPLVGALLLSGCFGGPGPAPPEPAAEVGAATPVEEETPPAPPPYEPPAPPVPLEGDAWEAWVRIHEVQQALATAPDWPVAPGRIPEDGAPWLRSKAWYVVDEGTGEVLTAKNAEEPRPIASITKLATAMVWSDAGVPGDRIEELLQSDKEHLQITRSRLRVGGRYRLSDLFYSALLSSDNRAAVMLARSTQLPMVAFTAAMSDRAEALGLTSVRFDDPTGLSEGNVASARDAARLLAAAAAHPTVGPAMQVEEHPFSRQDRRVQVMARSSNKLTHMDHWSVLASKTGYTVNAGSCLVLRTEIAGRTITAAFLGASGIETRYGDAARLRAWLEASTPE
jgi:D-alanyl-D-alanine endopeptidase (penicillin-binding protein 7)